MSLTLLIILIIIVVNTSEIKAWKYPDECDLGYIGHTFSDECGGCGICRLVEWDNENMRRALCIYQMSEVQHRLNQVFNPDSREKCEIMDFCKTMKDNCESLPCVPMLGSFKCVCEKGSIGQLCQYNVKDGMDSQDYPVIENILYNPLFTLNRHLTIVLYFSSLGSQKNLLIEIVTLMERLGYNHMALKKIDPSQVVDYCKSSFSYPIYHRYCTSKLFNINNVKWVFKVDIPFPGDESFKDEGRERVFVGNGTHGQLYFAIVEPVKLAIYNRNDAHPVFEFLFDPVNFIMSPEFDSVCEPVVFIFTGGQTLFEATHIKKEDSLFIETSYRVAPWNEYYCKNEFINYVFSEVRVWKYKINHFEKNNDYFQSKMQVQFVEFKKFSLELSMYKVRSNVSVWINKEYASSSVYSYFEVVFQNLEPSIKGGHSRSLYYKSSKIVLNGSFSRNPNVRQSEQAEDLIYYWKCDKNLDFCLEKQTNENYISYDGPFLKNEIYKFTLTIRSRKYKKQMEAEQTVNMVADPSPLLEIICRKNCGGFIFQSNPAESTYLEVLFVDAPSSIKKNNDFNWAYRSGRENSFKTVEKIRQANTPENVLIILENTLLKGETYFFQVKGGSSSPGEASFRLVMATGIPRISCVSSSSQEKKGFIGSTVTCEKIFHENLTPTYELYDRYPNNSDDKGRLLGSRKFHIFRHYSIVRGKLVVEVTNQFGVMTVSEVHVNAVPADDPLETVNELIKDFEFYHNTIEVEYKANILTTVIEMVSDNKIIFPSPSDIVKRLLAILSKEIIHSFANVKVWTSALDILVSIGSYIPFTPESVLDLSKLVVSLSSRLEYFVLSSENIFNDFTTKEISQLVQSMVNICDKICSTEIIQFNENYFSYLMKSSENIFLALQSIGTTIKKGTLKFAPPFIVKAKTITMWVKEDTPISLYKMSINQTMNASIPSVTVSKNFANYLNHFYSEVVLQVIVFHSNPYWWYNEVLINTNIVDLKLSAKKGATEQYITDLEYPIQVNLNYQELEYTIINGTFRQPNTNDSLYTNDLSLVVHQIRIEESGRLVLHFLDLKEGEVIKVLVLLNLRPDYELMMEIGQDITKSNPQYVKELKNPISQFSNNLYYLGIFPGNLSGVEHTNYSFQISILRCVTWQLNKWTSSGCAVKEVITHTKQLLCECSHLSSFAGFAGIPINTVNPFEDYRLLLTVIENPYVTIFVVCLLILYFIILFYTVRKDHRDKYKQCAIYLEDNLPYDNYPYLLCVQTGARLFAGTTSNVGISIEGSSATSRPHILRSTMFKALERAEDNWFILFSPLYLGEVKRLHIWIDYKGSRPEWFCNKIVVIDLTENKDYTFLIDSWFSLKWDDHVERFERTATLLETYREDLASDNFIYGFRENHLWLSVLSKHPRSGVSSSQRLSIVFCGVFAGLLASCMFYEVDDQLEDYPRYNIATKEILISVYTLIITGFLTNSVLSLYRRQLIVFDSEEADAEDEGESEAPQKNAENSNKHLGKTEAIFLRFVKDIFKVLVSRKKFVPVHLEIDILQKEKKRPKKQIFFEVLAWCVCLLVIFSCAYLVILYGLKFGKVKSLQWLSSNVMSVGEEVFVTSPVKIIAVAILSGMLFAKIYQVNKYDLDWLMILKYKKYLLKTHKDIFRKLLLLRSQSMYVPLNSKELERKKFKQWKKDIVWSFVDFLIIGIFAILLIVQSSNLWTTRYYWDNVQIKSVLKKTYKDEGFQFHELRNITHYLQFLEEKVFPSIYELKWYNGVPIRESVNISESIQSYSLSSSSRLLGLPVVRQRRRQPGLCQPNHIHGLPDLCPSRLTQDTEDTDNYFEKWRSAPPFKESTTSLAWTYQKPTTTYGIVGFGYNSLSYSDGGYIATLGLTQATSDDDIIPLESNGWIDKLTAMVFFEMTLYNPNSGTLNILISVSEQMYIGAVMNRLFIYTISQQYEYPAIDFILLASLLTFIIRVVFVFNRRGIRNIIVNFWNIFELLIACLGIYCAFQYMGHVNLMNEEFEAYGRREEEKHYSFIHVVTDLTYIEIVMIALLLMVSCRFMKSLNYDNSFSIYFLTVLTGWRTLLMLMAIILMTIFIYWSSISYFLNNFLSSKTFIVILHKQDFKYTAKRCTNMSCKLGLYTLCAVSDIFTLLIITHFHYFYRKVKYNKKEDVNLIIIVKECFASMFKKTL